MPALHDIGKIMIPSELLNKPGKLTDEEFDTIKRHPETGYQILKSVDEYVPIAKYVLHHHERWDGSGYPAGLKGEEIPLQSRIISVADAFEAMTQKGFIKKQEQSKKRKRSSSGARARNLIRRSFRAFSSRFPTRRSASHLSASRVNSPGSLWFVQAGCYKRFPIMTM